MNRAVVAVSIGLAILASATFGFDARAAPPRDGWRARHWASLAGRVPLTRRLTIPYRAHNGAWRTAIVVLPRWYGPRNHAPIPLVISPHGRGVEPAANVRMWGNMPALGRFAVVNPEGQGAKEELYSWGSPAQIADLARMPAIVHAALPWLRIAPHRIYAVGGSMGAQESLLLAAQHPRLLAGAISFDAPTNMAARYAAFPELRYGRALQQIARLEFGGLPRRRADAWADRSPIDYARELAFSGVPLEIWWSTRDRIVVDQASESGLLYQTIKRLNPRAPVVQYVGTWRHTAEMRATAQMPLALARLGLLHLGTATKARA
jgi:pimeloyl-ACP methyl ester carboxylesterase